MIYLSRYSFKYIYTSRYLYILILFFNVLFKCAWYSNVAIYVFFFIFCKISHLIYKKNGVSGSESETETIGEFGVRLQLNVSVVNIVRYRFERK